MLGIMAFTDQKDSCSDISIAGIAGDNAPRACSWVGRPMMFNITAVSYVPRRTVATWCPCSTAENCRVMVVDISFVPAEADPHGPGFSADH